MAKDRLRHDVGSSSRAAAAVLGRAWYGAESNVRIRRLEELNGMRYICDIVDLAESTWSNEIHCFNQQARRRS